MLRNNADVLVCLIILISTLSYCSALSHAQLPIITKLKHAIDNIVGFDDVQRPPHQSGKKRNRRRPEDNATDNEDVAARVTANAQKEASKPERSVKHMSIFGGSKQQDDDGEIFGKAVQRRRRSPPVEPEIHHKATFLPPVTRSSILFASCGLLTWLMFFKFVVWIDAPAMASPSTPRPSQENTSKEGSRLPTPRDGQRQLPLSPQSGQSPRGSESLGGLFTFRGSANEAAAADPTIPVLVFAAGPSKDRKPYLDTMKFLAIPMVAAWHIGCSTGRCDFISCHTRIFCFLSGLVSQSAPTKRAFKSLLFGLAIPTFMYCFVLAPFIFPFMQGRMPSSEDYQFHSVFDNLFKADARVIWFMIALIFWRIWGFMLMPLKPSLRIIVAVAFSAAAGYNSLGDTDNPSAGAFKLNNACAFFPVFVAGQLFPLDTAMSNVPYDAKSIAFGTTLLIVFWIIETSHTGQAFMNDIPIQGGWSSQLFQSAADAGLFWTRQLFFNIYAITKTCVFMLLCCPRGANFASDFGRHSIYPYLLHVPCVPLLARCLDLVGISLLGSHMTEYLAGFVLTTLLATWPVRAVFWVFLEPSWLQDWILIEDPADEAQETPRGESKPRSWSHQIFSRTQSPVQRPPSANSHRSGGISLSPRAI